MLLKLTICVTSQANHRCKVMMMVMMMVAVVVVVVMIMMMMMTTMIMRRGRTEDLQSGQ